MVATDPRAQTISTSFVITVVTNTHPNVEATGVYLIPDYTVATTSALTPDALFDISFNSLLFEDGDNDALVLTACRVIDVNTCAQLPHTWGL